MHHYLCMKFYHPRLRNQTKEKAMEGEKTQASTGLKNKPSGKLIS